jgi:serine protease Do
VEFDDGFGDDDEPAGPLLPPDDRLWRHPSEIASAGLPGRSASPPRRRRESRGWSSSFLSGTIGALLVIGMVTAVGGFRERAVPVRSTERIALNGIDAVPIQTQLTDPLIRLGDRLQPSIVQVRAERPEGVLNCSGFLFRTDGHILTSQRTVEGARSVKVTLSDASVHDAEIVGTDPDTGIAVLKIEGKAFNSAPLGSAASLRVGQVAVAMGAPLWMGAGVVAAMGKAVQSKDSPLLFDMIELNLAADPLTSGGPVLTGSGAVVGVIDVLDGKAYATPIDIARNVANQLITTGNVEYGYLGVEGGDTDSGTAARLHIDGGAVVRSINDGSPAYQAGVHVGDVITQVEDVKITTMAALKYSVRALRPGRAVTLRLLRDGQPLAINATLSERPPRY